MTLCNCCPRRCNVDRAQKAGFCGAGDIPRVARAALHRWEEPMFSGTRGSGAVFFSGCALRCIFCQNMDISALQKGEPCDEAKLADLFLSLQEQGAHNINLVTPTPHIRAITSALTEAKKKGLRVPVLYNTSGYETLDSLRSLEGLVDIYLPDLKYVTPEVSLAFSGAADYFQFAAPAILEMQRQTGVLQMDGAGIAKRGLLIRHLVLPGCIGETRRVLDFIAANFPRETHLSLMRQYTPVSPHLKAPLNRPLTAREYERAADYCLRIGLPNVLLQEASAATSAYTPPFFDRL
ncbi:MAG TPA: 4Fe-4S cluster-binding domain-containing protein [Feifaniaceae bacterium]|nr:4Fe-4S cluster-binding domain-containing protein [Feifaniaceae bacterium]